VALFGTISTVKGELDRHLAKSAADSSLIQELARLHRDDETWCVVKEFVRNNEIQHALGSLDSTLANLTSDGDAFQFGIRFGNRIRFEFWRILTSNFQLSHAILNWGKSKSIAPPQRLPHLPEDHVQNPHRIAARHASLPELPHQIRPTA
jgi:hypothetical protein